MNILADIAEWSIIAFALLLLIVQLLAEETGYRLGRWQRQKLKDEVDGVGVVVSGMLALVAFVLALTLSFASERFNERRTGTLAEANAIGTAWLRAMAIGQPRGVEIARLLEEYTQVRIDFVQASRATARLDEINRRTNALQSQIWGNVAAIVREQPNPVSTALMSAINDTFDMSTAERFAFDIRLPPPIFWLLIGMTLLGTGGLGYRLGLRGRPVRMLVVLFTAMWTVVIVDILDLAAARVGAFRTSVAAYEWTLQGFKGGITIPPINPPR